MCPTLLQECTVKAHPEGPILAFLGFVIYIYIQVVAERNMLWLTFKHGTCGLAYYHMVSCSKSPVCRWYKRDSFNPGKTSQIRERDQLCDNFMYDMIYHRLHREFIQELIQ